MSLSDHFTVITRRPRYVYVVHTATGCNAVPRALAFTSIRRANEYVRRAAPILVSGNLLRVTPETQAECAEIAKKLCAR